MQQSHLLRIKIINENVREYYTKKINNPAYKSDSGIDLIFAKDEEFICNKVTKVYLGIKCEFISAGDDPSGATSPFLLFPRSSISNTPLILANSVGLIDAGYRGEIIAAFRCNLDRDHQSTMNDFKYIAKQGDRLVQIVAPDLKPIRMEIVDELSQTQRGENGFGSTNKL